MPIKPAQEVQFRNDLPEEAEYALDNMPRLVREVQRHLDASGLCDLVGQPERIELERRDTLISARLKWTTPEGWSVELHPYFTVAQGRKRRGWCAFGPWGDGCVAHGSGLILSDGKGINALSLYAQNVAWAIREARLKPDKYRHWFTGNTEEEE